MSFVIVKNDSVGRVFILEDNKKIIDQFKHKYNDYDIYVSENPKEMVSFFADTCPFDKIYINTKFGLDDSLKHIGAVYYTP